jgi:hypothetical protein
MWENVESITKIKTDRHFARVNRLTEYQVKETKLVTVDTNLIKPCWEGFNLHFKKKEK